MKYYPIAVLWWKLYVKRMLRQLLQRAGTERKRDRENPENFYYKAIYISLNAPMDHAAKATTLKQLKANITRLHHYEQQRIFLDNDESDILEGEQPSLCHYIRANKRRDTRLVSNFQDGTGATHTNMTNILRTFTESLRTKYDIIPVDEENIRILMKNITKTLHCDANLALDAPITMEELLQAVKKGKPNKAPGSDGMSQDFFTLTWDLIKHDMLTIINKMYAEGKTTNKQKHGTIVCIPKKPQPLRRNDYRPLTLLNTDYK